MTESYTNSKSFDVKEAFLPLEEIKVKDRLRERLNEENVDRLMQSFQHVGMQIHPVTVDEHHVLVAGEHRLEAMRRLTAQGVPGWESIRALVVKGASEFDRRMIELEENQARAAMSPVEIEKAWASYGKPLFESKAKERKESLGVAAMNLSGDASNGVTVNGNTVNSDNEAPVALVAEARRTTGKSLDWLNKVADVRALAENENAPAELRDAAQRGLQRLSKPDAAVEPVWNALVKLQNKIRESSDAEEARLLALDKKLGATVRDVTLLEERLENGLAQVLREAAQASPDGGERLRAVRVSLTKALAYVVASECELRSDAQAALYALGGEVTQLLSEKTTALLEPRREHE